MTVQEFITFIQGLVQLLGIVGLVIGASATAAYILFKRYGERWIESKFESQLASYKHEQQKELEKVRFNINALLDRTIKLHQREFDILPEAWAKIIDAFFKTRAFISSIQYYPDIGQMSNAHLEEFLKGCQLGEWEKSELRSKPPNERSIYYIDHVYWNRLVDIRSSANETHTYILKNAIFLTPDIKEAFSAISDLAWEALMENQFNHEHKIVPEVRVKHQDLTQNGESMLKDLESKVYGRIWSKRDSITPLA